MTKSKKKGSKKAAEEEPKIEEPPLPFLPPLEPEPPVIPEPPAAADDGWGDVAWAIITTSKKKGKKGSIAIGLIPDLASKEEPIPEVPEILEVTAQTTTKDTINDDLMNWSTPATTITTKKLSKKGKKVSAAVAEVVPPPAPPPPPAVPNPEPEPEPKPEPELGSAPVEEKVGSSSWGFSSFWGGEKKKKVKELGPPLLPLDLSAAVDPELEPIEDLAPVITPDQACKLINSIRLTPRVDRIESFVSGGLS